MGGIENEKKRRSENDVNIGFIYESLKIITKKKLELKGPVEIVLARFCCQLNTSKLVWKERTSTEKILHRMNKSVGYFLD